MCWKKSANVRKSYQSFCFEGDTRLRKILTSGFPAFTSVFLRLPLFHLVDRNPAVVCAFAIGIEDNMAEIVGLVTGIGTIVATAFTIAKTI